MRGQVAGTSALLEHVSTRSTCTSEPIIQSMLGKICGLALNPCCLLCLTLLMSGELVMSPEGYTELGAERGSPSSTCKRSDTSAIEL